MMPKVHIILINYKNWQDTIECLQSLENLEYSNFEITISEVCDLNNSRAELNNFLKNYPIKTKILKLSDNNGFAFANNHAIEYALNNCENNFFWILNNDTTVQKKALSKLVEFYQQNNKNNKIGFLGSKVLEYSNPKIIQTVGGYFNPQSGYSILIGKNEPDTNQYSKPFETDYVIGASMFFHKSLLTIIGFMPDDYFLYYEDIDWCITAHKKGFENFTVPQSVILHKQGAATGNKYTKKKTSSPTRKYMYINYIKFFKKHYPKQYKKGYLLLFKQALGQFRRFNFNEAFTIIKTIFISV